MTKEIQNLGESIRQKLNNLSKKQKRPFDEVLRYYAIERFLYRLSISSFANSFFLKGGLLLKVWNYSDHRATMDIDLLARTSNKIDNLRTTIIELSNVDITDDAISFDTQNLLLKKRQIGGEYHGISASFSAMLFKSKIPILIDIGFNDIIIPEPKKIQYPTLLNMTPPYLFGYTPETVVAEKLESIVKLKLINTRMKDFYDIWTIFSKELTDSNKLASAINKVFCNRKTKLEYPIAFSNSFYEDPETKKRWRNFLMTMRKEPLELKQVISEISQRLEPIFSKASLQ